jgi:superfamily II DNA or RNA helicase
VLIAGLKIAGQGLDIPDLDVVINASAHLSVNDSIQIIGRIKRKCVGKKFGYYFDFWDSGYFMKASRARFKDLREFGNDAVVVDWDKVGNII